jgi:hypothetical protein
MSKINFSLFLTIILIVGLFFVAVTENTNAEIVPMQGACSIVIEKIEIPDTGRDFDFELTGSFDDNFGLANGESTVLDYQENGNGVLIENIPQGYTLNIECTEGEENCSDNGGFETCLSITPLEDGNGVTIQCDDSATNDEGSCTFTNTLITRNVPTLSQWSLIAVVGLLAIIGFLVIRRRQLTTNS